MKTTLSKLVTLWESTQVELHGSYSPQRVLALSRYTHQTSWFHVIAVLVITPLPCLVITILSDVLPLDDPSKELKKNLMFQVRQYFSYLVMSYLAAQQFRVSVPALPYPNWKVIRNTFVVAAVCVLALNGLKTAIGFPVPFSVILGVPAWIGSVAVSLAIEWRGKIKETPGSGMMVINTIKVWLVEVMLVIIYPPYYYVFTTLSKTGQMMFTSLLPLIKLVMRNIFIKTVIHLSDELPEVVVFNSEVFNALFVAYCMQNSPSVGTTLMVTAALLIQLALSLRDVKIALHIMESVQRQLTLTSVRENRNRAAKSGMRGHVATALETADSLLQVQHKIHRTNPLQPQVKPAQSGENIYTISSDPRHHTIETEDPSSFRHGKTRIQPAKQEAVVHRHSKEMLTALTQYTLALQKLLYLTEFLVLIYYVGVFIPLIFSIYMGAMYRLPNRKYYAQLADLTEDELTQALNNVMFSCSLKLFALLLLCGVLKYKLRFSALHQLAFVLENQWAGVQTKLIFWVFYVVQASLEHHGYDYTFQFAWLKTPPPDDGNSTPP